MKALESILIHGDGNNPCVMCGKEIKENGKFYYLHMCPDGTLIDDQDDPIEFEPQCEMGYFPVGMSCYKRFLKQAKDVTKEYALEHYA